MVPTSDAEALSAIDVLQQAQGGETAPVSSTSIAIKPTTSAATRLSLPDLSDEMLLDYRAALEEQRTDLRTVEHAIDLEVERRLRERGARALLHPSFDKVELEEQHTAYAFDVSALCEAAVILRQLGKEDEAAKLVKLVPEQTTIVPEHYEPGNPRSITALREKYGQTPGIGSALGRAMNRQSLGSRLVIKRKAGAR